MIVLSLIHYRCALIQLSDRTACLQVQAAQDASLFQEWMQDIRLTSTVSLLHSRLMIAATEARWIDVSFMRCLSA